MVVDSPIIEDVEVIVALGGVVVTDLLATCVVVRRARGSLDEVASREGRLRVKFKRPGRLMSFLRFLESHCPSSRRRKPGTDADGEDVVADVGPLVRRRGSIETGVKIEAPMPTDARQTWSIRHTEASSVIY